MRKHILSRRTFLGMSAAAAGTSLAAKTILLDPEPLHDHPADTVRKTPALIVIALEGLPRVRDILGEDPDDLCNLLRKERGAYPESPLKLPPHFHQG